MNAPRAAFRITSDVVARMVILFWLLGLSVAVVLGFRAVSQLAEQVQTSVESQQILALEARVAELAAGIQALETKPAPATAVALQNVQQSLRENITRIEQALEAFVTMEAIQALHSEIEQIKAHQTAVRAAPTPAPRRPAKPDVVSPKPEPFPYRVIGAELRAGLRSVLVTPATDGFSADQIQVLLPGDAIGAWRLQTIPAKKCGGWRFQAGAKNEASNPLGCVVVGAGVFTCFGAASPRAARPSCSKPHHTQQRCTTGAAMGFA